MKKNDNKTMFILVSAIALVIVIVSSLIQKVISQLLMIPN